MDFFVVLPDQYHCTRAAMEIMAMCERVYVVEDPVWRPVWSANREKRLRDYVSILKQYIPNLNVELKTTHRTIIKRISMDKCALRGSFLDYFVGERARCNMFRPNGMWYWGWQICERKFNGLEINFYDSGSALLTFDEERKLLDNRMLNRMSSATISFGKFVRRWTNTYKSVVGGSPSVEHLENMVQPPVVSFLDAEAELSNFNFNNDEFETVVHTINTAATYSPAFMREYVLPAIECGYMTVASVAKRIVDTGDHSALAILLHREWLHAMWINTGDYLFGGNKERPSPIFSAISRGTFGPNDMLVESASIDIDTEPSVMRLLIMARTHDTQRLGTEGKKATAVDNWITIDQVVPIGLWELLISCA